MADYFKGLVRQVTPGTTELIWRKAEPHSGNDLKFSEISEASINLDTSRFHITLPLKGKEPYLVDGHYYETKPGEYFIFNPSQEVRVEGAFKEKVKGLCFFLTKETLAEVTRSNRCSIEENLDSPFDYSWQQEEFLVKNYQLKENSFGYCLQRISKQILQPEASLLVDWDSFYYELITEFLLTHQQISRHLQSIPSVRSLTRQEIYKRLSIAHCYILENFADPVSLDDLAQVSYFSKYYIIRLYRQIYGQTPYQHLLQLRIEKAKELLEKGFAPTEIANALSFSDRRAFSKIFKKITKISPSAFQLSKRKR